MNNKVLIQIKNNSISTIIRKCFINKIFFEELDNNQKTIIVSIKDLKLINSVFGKKNIKLLKYYGLNGFKNYFKKEYLFIISSIISIIVIYILSNIIFSIEVKTSNKEIKKIIMENLENYDIKKYSFFKDYEEVENIKKEILKKNKEVLEWIELERYGTKYVISITERVKKEIKEEKIKRNVVASKDALILKIINRKGQVLKSVNDYVKSGEIIVSGDIYRNEEAYVNSVAADADVYGEVWYTVSVTIPFEYTEYIPTKKIINHYYLKVGDFKMSLIGKYNTNNEIIEKEIILNKPYLFFKIVKEKKSLYEYKNYKLNEKEAIEEGVLRASSSIERTLKEDERIIEKKVLKNESFSSKIVIEVFFRVYENITSYAVINKTLESSDVSEGNL